MTKQNQKTVIGSITECLPNATFRFELPDGSDKIGFLSGKMRVYKIKVIPGDRVQVELDPYGGKCTNRIIRRL